MNLVECVLLSYFCKKKSLILLIFYLLYLSKRTLLILLILLSLLIITDLRCVWNFYVGMAQHLWWFWWREHFSWQRIWRRHGWPRRRPSWPSRYYSHGISQIQHLIYCTYITYGTYRSRASTCHILGPVPWRWWSWVWARPLDEEKERIWRRGNSQSRPLVLQEYGWRERQSWTVSSPLVFSLFEYLIYVPYLCYLAATKYIYYTYFGRVSN